MLSACMVMSIILYSLYFKCIDLENIFRIDSTFILVQVLFVVEWAVINRLAVIIDHIVIGYDFYSCCYNILHKP